MKTSLSKKITGILITILTAILIVLPSLVFAQDEAKPITFVGNHNIPPMIFLQNTKPVGLVVDIAHAIADRAELNAEVIATDWEEAQRMVLEEEADAVLQINRNPEREKLYDFSEPLLRSDFCIFRKDDSIDIRNLESLFGHTVGVERQGYPYLLLKKYPQINLKIIPSWRVGFELINSGEIHAVVVDRWVGEYELFVNHIRGITVIEKPIETSYTAIAVKKGNQQLLDKINYGLEIINKDGTRNAIQKKWSKQEIIQISKETLYQYLTFIGVFVIAVLLTLIALILIYAININRMNNHLQLHQKRLTAEISERERIEQELHSANENLRRLSETDSLTGLNNRRQFDREYKHQFDLLKRGKTFLSLLVIDIDFFKAYNDHYGHDQGDVALKLVAKVMRESVARSTDFVFRYGGEEFTVLLPHTDEEGALTVANLIVSNLEQENIEHKYSQIGDRLSISIGVASMSEVKIDSDAQVLFHRADMTLYHAKNSGRNRALGFSAIAHKSC